MGLMNSLGRMVLGKPAPVKPLGFPYNNPPRQQVAPLAPALPQFEEVPAIVRKVEDFPAVALATARLEQLVHNLLDARRAVEVAFEKSREKIDVSDAALALVDGGAMPEVAVITPADIAAARRKVEALELAVKIQRARQVETMRVATRRIEAELTPGYVAAARELAVALVHAANAKAKMVAFVEALRRESLTPAGDSFFDRGGLGVGGAASRISEESIAAMLTDFKRLGVDLLGDGELRVEALPAAAPSGAPAQAQTSAPQQRSTPVTTGVVTVEDLQWQEDGAED